MKWLCIWLIRFYQRFISPLKGRPTCRFTPSCSAYGLEAFRKRGFFVGLFLTVRRILRCNPFHPGGYDPVPDRGELFRSRTTEHSDKGTQPKRMCEDYVCRRPRGASDSDPEPTSTQATTDSTSD